MAHRGCVILRGGFCLCVASALRNDSFNHCKFLSKSMCVYTGCKCAKLVKTSFFARWWSKMLHSATARIYIYSIIVCEFLHYLLSELALTEDASRVFWRMAVDGVDTHSPFHNANGLGVLSRKKMYYTAHPASGSKKETKAIQQMLIIHGNVWYFLPS